jgi:hypothetical protein
MGWAIVGSAGRGSGRWQKAKTDNGDVGVGKCFCELFVRGDEFCHRVILLESGVCKVVKAACLALAAAWLVKAPPCAVMQ